MLQTHQISFHLVGKKCLGLGDRLTKKENNRFIKRCYVTVHEYFGEIFGEYIAFNIHYVCAKFRLNRWEKKCLGLGERLTKNFKKELTDF